MKTIKRSFKVVEPENDRPELCFPSDALEDTIQIQKTAAGYIGGCLCPDETAENPIENCDGMGAFFHWKDHGREELVEYCRLRGFDPDTREVVGKADPDAVLIDKYEHSGVAYSVMSEGTNCRWDTSTAWAVWYPDKCLLDELKELKGQKRRDKCVEYARQACEEINKWFSGEVYGVVVITFDNDGEEVDRDSCWGYFGYEYAEEELKSQMKHYTKEKK